MPIFNAAIVILVQAIQRMHITPIVLSYKPRTNVMRPVHSVFIDIETLLLSVLYIAYTLKFVSKVLW